MATVRFDHAALDRLLDSAAGPVARDLARRALRVDAAAKRLCPVDTGRLRSSIGWRLAVDGRGLAAFVGTDVSYAPHVEFGTYRMRAQPFLRPALRAAR